MALQVPRAVARFNRAVNNPIQLTYAWLLPPWAVICHRGRRTGRWYRTPVNAYRRDRLLAVVILYGEDSDWVRNLLARGRGAVLRAGRAYVLRDCRVITVSEAAELGVPLPARIIGRVSGKLLVGELHGPVSRKRDRAVAQR